MTPEEKEAEILIEQLRYLFANHKGRHPGCEDCQDCVRFKKVRAVLLEIFEEGYGRYNFNQHSIGYSVGSGWY